MSTTPHVDALTPVEMARKLEQIGVNKAGQAPGSTLVLALLAGMYVSFGAIFSTTALAGSAGVVPYGLSRVIAGFTFTLALMLVVVGGAELFTGNTLMVISWAQRRIRLGAMLRNWAIVYCGNFVGALITAALMVAAAQYSFGQGTVGAAALNIARTKLQLGWGQALALGVLANTLVCLALWLSFSARSTTDRLLAVMFPLATFVAAGFEHSIANMYFVPVALWIKQVAPPSFWQAIGATPADYAVLSWSTFVWHNLIPVTLGNILGGAVVVGGAYWWALLRQPAAAQRSESGLTGAQPAAASR